MDTRIDHQFVPERRPVSLPEPTCAFPTLTGAFSDFVPENRFYREQIGAEVRPFDAAFANRPLGRLDIETKYHDEGDGNAARTEAKDQRNNG